MRPFFSLITGALLLAAAIPAGAQATNPPEREALFAKVFGDAATLDPAKVAQVKGDTPGKRHWFDTDGDGRANECWFIDLAGRHREERRPLLVRAIDEDGDMREGIQPDRDSDLYVADWKADGAVDVILDFQDNDGDNDLDEMAHYFYQPANPNQAMIHHTGVRAGEPAMRAWWSRDDGDDNLLWGDVDYTYYQTPVENSTHFNGDETFVSFILYPSIDRWMPFFENPFLFYDRDADGVSEEVMRLDGVESEVETVRWSFDVDNDGTLESPRDYDASFTAWAQGSSITPTGRGRFHSDLHYLPGDMETTTLRGIATGPFVTRPAAPAAMRPVTWERVILAWDENDHNVDWELEGARERWEGVITHPDADFPPMGSPTAGPYNKRYEIVIKPQGPNQFYFNPAEGRLHLRDVDKAWLVVDWNGDKTTDSLYRFSDADGDGMLEHVAFDADADGEADDEWTLDVAAARPVEWMWQEVHRNVAPVYATDPPRLHALNVALAAALAQRGVVADPLWAALGEGMKGTAWPEDVARKMLGGNDGLLYFLRVAADRQLAALGSADEGRGWRALREARSRGDFEAMTAAVREIGGDAGAAGDYEPWLATLRAGPSTPRVAWDSTWLPPNWGWESEKIAYRFNMGHFDFFGKREDTLVYPTAVPKKPYNVDEGWGMDAIHVGTTTGCGGLLLYAGDGIYPIYADGATTPTFEYRMLEETAERVTLEIVATGVGPAEAPFTVTIRPTALAGRYDSPVEVVVTGGPEGLPVTLGIGLNRLPE